MMTVGRRAAGLIVAFGAAAAAAAARADEADAPAVTPYRPTVSDPADLSAPGWLEAEFGGLRTLGADGSASNGVPFLLKYSFDEDHGILVGGNAYTSVHSAAMRDRGVGDLVIEWKQRFAAGAGTAFGVEAGAIVPSASADLGVGQPAWLVNGIFSSDLGPLHLDLNLAQTRFSRRAADVSAWQSQWAASVSAAPAEDLGVAFELSGTHQRGMPTRSQALVAVSRNVSRRLVVDAGVARGLAHDAHDRSFFAGATFLVGRLR
jgi:hypothetical protein